MWEHVVTTRTASSYVLAAACSGNDGTSHTYLAAAVWCPWRPGSHPPWVLSRSPCYAREPAAPPRSSSNPLFWSACVCLRVKPCRLERYSREHVGRHAGLRCTAEPSQPTSYARSFAVAGRRRSTATRTNSLLSDTPNLVVIRSQIRRILSHTDGDYANVTSNMRWRPAGETAVHAPYTGWQCNRALWHARQRPCSHAAAAAGNSGGRMAPSPAARSCADGERIMNSDPQ